MNSILPPGNDLYELCDQFAEKENEEIKHKITRSLQLISGIISKKQKHLIYPTCKCLSIEEQKEYSHWCTHFYGLMENCQSSETIKKNLLKIKNFAMSFNLYPSVHHEKDEEEDNDVFKFENCDYGEWILKLCVKLNFDLYVKQSLVTIDKDTPLLIGARRNSKKLSFLVDNHGENVMKKAEYIYIILRRSYKYVDGHELITMFPTQECVSSFREPLEIYDGPHDEFKKSWNFWKNKAFIIDFKKTPTYKNREREIENVKKAAAERRLLQLQTFGDMAGPPDGGAKKNYYQLTVLQLRKLVKNKGLSIMKRDKSRYSTKKQLIEKLRRVKRKNSKLACKISKNKK